MNIFALADLHLAIGTPEKTMEVFGPRWHNYMQRIEANWKRLVAQEDLVLLPGDISWAMHMDEAKKDLEWLDALPGTKVMIRGNHDYWWGTKTKLSRILPPSVHCIHNDAFAWHGIGIGGSRLWDTAEYTFESYMDLVPPPRGTHLQEEVRQLNEKLFARELERLKRSLSQIDPHATMRIAMTHYPPIGPELRPSRTSAILEEYRIETCVFGHLHNVRPGTLPFGEARGVRYLFTSCDYVECTPVKIPFPSSK